MPQTLPKITDRQYRTAARKLHETEGEVEIDASAVVSRSNDGGAYIQAWVWVSNSEV